jgi:hypothetical protein
MAAQSSRGGMDRARAKGPMIATPTPPDVDPSTYRFVVNGRVVYEPFAKQVDYHASRAPYRLFGGSKGAGKSKCIRWDHYIPSFVVPGMKSLILRRMKLELQRSHLRFVPKEAKDLGLGERALKRNEAGAAVLYFPNGSLIEFGHCHDETSIEQYLSAEYDRISFDEVVTFTEEMYLAVSTSCRTTIPGLIPSIGGGTNPVTKKAHGGYWVKRRWILKDITLDEDESYDPNDYEYIPALPADNPYLNWQQYKRQLDRLPPSLRAAYRDGDWDASEDGFFSEFRKYDKPPLEDGVPRKAHVIDFPRFTNGTPRFCGLDWGYMTDEGVCLWAVYADDGHLYIEDEYVFNGKHRDRYIAKEVAEQIVQRNRKYGLQVRKTWCDPKMGERTGHESVETVMSTFAKHGVPCVMGERDRENGWARLRAWLRNHPDGTPFLRINRERCPYLIRTFSELSVDDHNDHDLDTDGPDHATDALRFLVSGLKAPVEESARLVLPPESVGALRAELMRPPAPSVLGHLNVQGARHGVA